MSTDPGSGSANHPCPHCQEVFLESDHAALHVGRRHGDGMTATQRDAFQAAMDREAAWLAAVRRRVRGLLQAFPLVATYFFVLVAAHAAGVFALGLLLAPGVAAFALLLYALGASPRRGAGASPHEEPPRPRNAD